MRWFGLSIAPFSKHNERFARQYRYEPPPGSLLTLPFSGCVDHPESPGSLVSLKPLSRSRNVHIYIYKEMHIHIHMYIFSKFLMVMVPSAPPHNQVQIQSSEKMLRCVLGKKSTYQLCNRNNFNLAYSHWKNMDVQNVDSSSRRKPNSCCEKNTDM